MKSDKQIIWHVAADEERTWPCGHEILGIRGHLVFVQAACGGDKHDGVEASDRIAVDARQLSTGARPIDPSDRPEGTPYDFGNGAYGLADPCGCGEFYLTAEAVPLGEPPHARARRARHASHVERGAKQSPANSNAN